VAVIGGGQLARMMAQAAVGLGVRLHLLAEGPDVSAAQVVPGAVVGDYRDLETLREAAEGCSVVTFDHEHVPTEHLHTLTDEGHACRPGPEALVHAQDKAVMRARLGHLGVPCPRNAVVADADDVDRFADTVGGYPVVLKTTRGGYDGKGVWVVRSRDDAAEAFAVAAASGVDILAEELVDFRRELSALVARSPSGQVAAYPVVESVQRDGICWEVLAPAPGLGEDLAVEAQQIAMKVAGALDVTGILAVEMFETQDGRVLVNELAMRPHNTGHWSMDGAVTGQFENHLRAVLDLPLGSPEARAPWTVMVNILGGEHGPLSENLYGGYPHVFARDPRLKVHLYGKDVKPGRKVGHVTAYGDDLDEVRERAQHAAAWFRGDLGNESE
jgi:5-(carboxyamino)imidazole ribonucleotide synthase